MSGFVALAAALGICLGVGAWTLLALVPRYGAPRLARRTARYLIDVSTGARDLTEGSGADPGGVVLGLSAPLVATARRVLAMAFGGDDALRRRLRQAGADADVARFRERQLLSGTIGLALGAAVAALAAGSGASVVVMPMAVVLGGAGGAIVPDRWLSRRIRRRRARIEAELPATLDLLALALSAGLGVADAIDRVGLGGGELPTELSRAVAQTRAGASLPAALSDTADALDTPSLSRALDQLVAALHRGAPLAEVLRAQAADARGEARQHLIEVAGRKEVAMLVPLVLLILPVTIAFALAPAALVFEVGQ